jgi:FkbM family methyltransferase
MKFFEISPANPVAREIARWARKYLRHYRGFSYDFRGGGEERVLRRLASFKFDTVFDVGANTGGWAIRVQRYFPEASIHTFEISEKTFQILQRDLPGPAFHHNCFGLAEAAGERNYLDYGDSSHVNTLIERSRFHDQALDRREKTSFMENGDGYCHKNGIDRIDFLKIDVEGAEHLVLKGFGGMLHAGKIRVVQFEYGYVNGDAGFLMRDFYELFESQGYVVAPIRNRPMEFRPFEYGMNDFDSGPNYLAVCREDREILQALARP